MQVALRNLVSTFLSTLSRCLICAIAPADLPPFFTTTSRLHTRHPTNIHERILNLFFLNTQRARIINLSSHRIPRVYMSAIHQHLYLFTTSRHAIPPATSVLASRVEGEFVLYVSKARGSCYVDRGVLARDDESSSGEQDVCMGGLRLAYADHRSTQPSAAPSRCLPTFALRCRIKFDGFVVGRWVVHCEEGVSLPRRHVSTSGEQGCGVVEVATLRTCSKRYVVAMSTSILIPKYFHSVFSMTSTTPEITAAYAPLGCVDRRVGVV